MAKRKLKKKIKGIICLIIFILLLTISSKIVEYKYLSNRNLNPQEIKKEYYTSLDFGFIEEKSIKDNNYNQVDDYIDMLNGALKKVETTKEVISDYYADGYPPETEGISSDIIWAALKEAGYNLKDLMARDIRDTYKQKVYDIDIIDDNIDFRRINNIEIFLQRYAEELTTDIENVTEFTPGDIIIFNYGEHVAIVSNKRNKNAIPYIIQITSKQEKEINLESIDMNLTSHYRLKHSEKLQQLINKT